jgi:hypothetical protein
LSRSKATDGGLAQQERLFTPPSPEPPGFDTLCPPSEEQQLAIDLDAAINAAAQTTVYDYVR